MLLHDIGTTGNDPVVGVPEVEVPQKGVDIETEVDLRNALKSAERISEENGIEVNLLKEERKQ